MGIASHEERQSSSVGLHAGRTGARFHLCTLANDTACYDRMRRSFVAAGFDDSTSRYTCFDNRGVNQYEPYSAINEALDGTDAPFVIFAHQDVEANHGDGLDRLVDVLDELERRDPRWAVAGNAGITEAMAVVERLTCREFADVRVGDFRRPVAILDENFLVIKTSTGVRCSTKLRGFHLYGADLCMNARAAGYTCYVLDFHLTHHGTGTADTAGYIEALEAWRELWSPRFLCTFVPTMFGPHLLSRYGAVRRTLGARYLRGCIQRHPKRYAALWTLAHPLAAMKSPHRRRSGGVP